MTEVKNKGGRPATGRIRNKVLGNRYTQKELDEIKKLVSENSDLNMSDAILKAIRNEFKKTK